MLFVSHSQHLQFVYKTLTYTGNNLPPPSGPEQQEQPPHPAAQAEFSLLILHTPFSWLRLVALGAQQRQETPPWPQLDKVPTHTHLPEAHSACSITHTPHLGYTLAHMCPIQDQINGFLWDLNNANVAQLLRRLSCTCAQLQKGISKIWVSKKLSPLWN